MTPLVPHLIVAQKVGNALTDADGKQLRIKPHLGLARLAIAKPNTMFAKWMQDAEQEEWFASVIGCTIFAVSKRGESRTLLNAPIEWWLLWHIPHCNSLCVILLEYDDLNADQERALVHAYALRLLSYPLTNRTKVQLGMQWGFFGLTKRNYATLMGRAEPTLHYHLSQVVTMRPKPTPPPPDKLQPEALIPSVESERIHLNQEPPFQPVEPATFSLSSPNGKATTDLTACQVKADAELQGSPFTATQEPSFESIPTTTTIDSAFDALGTPVSLCDDGQDRVGQQENVPHWCPAADDRSKPAQAESTTLAHVAGVPDQDAEGLPLSSDQCDRGECVPSQANADPAQVSPWRVEDASADKKDGNDRPQLTLAEFNTGQLEKAGTQTPASTSRIGAGRRRGQTKSEQLGLFVARV